MTFRMKGSVFPGDTMVFTGTVTGVGWTTPAAAGSTSIWTWPSAGTSKTACTARIAVPISPDDNPWARRGERWRP